MSVKPTAAAGALLLAACLMPTGARAQTGTALPAPVVIDPDANATGINPTGKPVILTAPVMDGQAYLGDATVTLDPGGRASFSAERLLTLLEPRIAAPLVARLRTRLGESGQLDGADLRGVGVSLAGEQATKTRGAQPGGAFARSWRC